MTHGSESRVSLSALFHSLPTPLGCREFPTFASSLVGVGRHRLGKDESGEPSLLVSARSGLDVVRSPPVELTHLVVHHDMDCLLWQSDRASEPQLFTLVRCRSADGALREYFLRVLETVLPILGPDPSRTTVHDVVSGLAELFRALTLPPARSVQGLWAELFLLAHAADPMLAARSWRTTPTETYDFSTDNEHVEVKSFSEPPRRHHFTLDQVRPPSRTSAVIASILARRVTGGVSLGDLLEVTLRRVRSAPEVALSVERVVASSLGSNWRNSLGSSFDADRARDSLAFYDASSIPAIDSPLPPAVSDVRFACDLTSVAQVDPKTLAGRGRLFAAIRPTM